MDLEYLETITVWAMGVLITTGMIKVSNWWFSINRDRE